MSLEESGPGGTLASYGARTVNQPTRISEAGVLKTVDTDFLFTSDWARNINNYIEWNSGNPVNPLEFGAVGDGVTDDTVALNNAFQAVRESAINIPGAGSVVIRPFVSPPGMRYKVTGSLNLTQLPSSRFFWNGSIVESFATGKIALDMFGAAFVTINDLTLVLNSTSNVKVGIAVGRTDLASYTPKQLYDRKPSANHRFNNCKIIGPASVASYYNFSSESTQWTDSQIINTYATQTVADTTYGVILDNYNDWNSGSWSEFSPHTVPQGCRPGTHNQNRFLTVEIRGRGNLITPLWMNGPRDLLFDGYMVSGSDYAVYMGAGGFSTNGDEEQSNYSNQFLMHAESYSTGDEDIPINYYFKIDNSVRDVTLDEFVNEDLRIHPNIAGFTTTGGTKSITFNRSRISWNTPRASAVYAYPFDPTYRAHFKYNGSFKANGALLDKNSITLTTTSGLTTATFTLTGNAFVAGDRIGMRNDLGLALETVNGVTLFGNYSVTAVSGDLVTIETGQTASASGSGTLGVGGRSVVIEIGRLLDLDSGVILFSGDIQTGSSFELIKAPVGSYDIYSSDQPTGIRKGDMTIYGNSNTRGTLSTMTRRQTHNIPSNASVSYTTPGMLSVTGVSVTGGSIAAAAKFQFTLTLTGAERGDMVSASPEFTLGSDVMLNAVVTATNTVTVTLTNTGAASYTLPTNTWSARVLR